MTRYVALLRGINVGGKNLIGMPALKALFESQGFSDVVTYIQSGNVIFSADGKPPALVTRIEDELSDTFGYAARIVLRSKQQMRAVVGQAPGGFGTKPAVYRYEVIFLKDGLSAPEVVKTVSVRDGVDRAWAGRGVLYFSRLVSRAAQSRLSRLVSMPVYQQMTIRNWNTTRALLRMLDERR